MIQRLKLWWTNRREVRRIHRRLKRILRDVGTERMTLAEYAARKKIQYLKLEEICEAELDHEIESLRLERKSLGNLLRAVLLVWGALALFYFGIGSDLLLGTFSLQITEATASAVLFIFSIMNIFAATSIERISTQESLLQLIFGRRPELDPSGLKSQRLRQTPNVIQEFLRDFERGRLNIVGFGALYAAFQTISALVALSAMLAFVWLPLASAWAVGSNGGWKILDLVVFIFVLIGILSMLILPFVFNLLRLRFVDPGVSKEFCRNFKEHGWEVAFSVLEDRLGKEQA